jgi:hypothetical protein
MPFWILYAVPVLLSAAATASFLHSLSMSGAAGRNELTVGLVCLLVGSLIVSLFFLGAKIPLVQAVSKRWIEPWGYFGYIPVFAVAAPFAVAGRYFIKKYFS